MLKIGSAGTAGKFNMTKEQRQPYLDKIREHNENYVYGKDNGYMGICQLCRYFYSSYYPGEYGGRGEWDIECNHPLYAQANLERIQEQAWDWDGPGTETDCWAFRPRVTLNKPDSHNG